MRNDGKIRGKNAYREGELKKDTRWWRAWRGKIHRTWKEKVALNQNWDKRGNSIIGIREREGERRLTT